MNLYEETGRELMKKLTSDGYAYFHDRDCAEIRSRKSFIVKAVLPSKGLGEEWLKIVEDHAVLDPISIMYFYEDEYYYQEWAYAVIDENFRFATQGEIDELENRLMLEEMK